MTTIYAVVHSHHAAEHFASLLRAQEIALLVDVRSHPTSKWAPQFGKPALAKKLATHGVAYEFLGRELGGRTGLVTAGKDWASVAASRPGAPRETLLVPSPAPASPSTQSNEALAT